MGTISSVYVGPARANTETNSNNEERLETTEIYATDDSEPELVETNDCEEGRRESQGEVGEFVTEIHLNHSFCSNDEKRTEHSDRRESEMGITIQYLAEENVKLVRVNKQLTKEIERLKADLSDIQREEDNQDRLFGETLELKVNRLEKTLEAERKEKWESIEKSELARVSLINCERELSEKNKVIEELRKELDDCRAQIQIVESQSRLKEVSECSEVVSEENTQSKSTPVFARKAEMERFRADLIAKREARQKALSAVSEEMKKLREDLENERTLRRKLEREALLQKPVQIVVEDESAVDLSIVCVKKENETLKKELDFLAEDIEKLKDLKGENSNLKEEIKQLSQQIQRLKTTILQLKNDYGQEKRMHERTVREKKQVEEEKERSIKRIHESEYEKERMWEEYDREKEEINKRTTALKEVIAISKQMLVIRETQVQELKSKLKDIEEAVNDKKKLEEEGLRAEYEKQLANIKTLKELYEERVRLMEMERDKLHETITTHNQTIEEQKAEISEWKGKFETTAEELQKGQAENENLERDLRLSVAKSKDFENELTLINNMFTQMLLGQYNTGNETDLVKLTELLQENHELITELTSREESSEIASALPKLLLDLITQVDANDSQMPLKMDDSRTDIMLESTDTISEQSESLLEENHGAVLPILSYKDATVFKNSLLQKENSLLIRKTETSEGESHKLPEAINPTVQEIASNLPKVWKVLMELLSHHTAPKEHSLTDEKQCYKYIETPNGTRSVISVSNTFIRLKDLILEKKSLQKELGKLKHLNSHLETRLDDQEKRLSQVQCELHKTWGIVGRMRAQHQQLHNHEKILRYELQEKRVMLGELKQELEYCRENWERARQKNNESETEWRKLRREFSARKAKGYSQSTLNDSAESGYSDEPNESGEEAENCDADRSSTQSPIDGQLSVQSVTNVPGTAAVSPTDSTTNEVVVEEETLNQTSPEDSISQNNIESTATSSTSTGAIPRVPGNNETRPTERDARAIRLKRLEDQCQLLVQKVDITTHKSNFLSNRLEELHEQYGQGSDNSISEEAIPSLNQLDKTTPTNEIPSSVLDPSSESSTVELDIKRAKLNQVEQEELRASEMPNIQSRTYANVNSEASSTERSPPKLERTTEEILKARDERLKRLEAQCQSLVGKVTNTMQKSSNLSNKLEEIHDDYLAYETAKENKSVNSYTPSDDGACAINFHDSTVEIGISENLQSDEERIERINNLEQKSLLLIGEVTKNVQKSTNLSNSLEVIKVECESHKDCGNLTEENMKNLVAEEPKTTETRAERLQRLEEQGKLLVGKLTNSVQKGSNISNRLEEIHENYVAHEARKGESYNLNLSEENTIEQKSTETREERLQRLEKLGQSLIGKLSNTVKRGTDLSNKLEEIHEGHVTSEESDKEASVPDVDDPKAEEESIAKEISSRESREERDSSMGKVTNTSQKSRDLSNKMDQAHCECMTHQEIRPNCPESGTKMDLEGMESTEDALDKRSEKLKRLEEQGQSLVGKLANTLQKGNNLSNKLGEIHEWYVKHEETKNQASLQKDNRTRKQLSNHEIKRQARIHHLRYLEARCIAIQKKVSNAEQKSTNLPTFESCSAIEQKSDSLMEMVLEKNTAELTEFQGPNEISTNLRHFGHDCQNFLLKSSNMLQRIKATSIQMDELYDKYFTTEESQSEREPTSESEMNNNMNDQIQKNNVEGESDITNPQVGNFKIFEEYCTELLENVSSIVQESEELWEKIEKSFEHQTSTTENLAEISGQDQTSCAGVLGNSDHVKATLEECHSKLGKVAGTLEESERLIKKIEEIHMECRNIAMPASET